MLRIGVFEFDSSDVARLATDRLNNTAFDKSHTISVYTLPDFENIISTSEKFVPPKIVSKVFRSLMIRMT